MAINTQFNSKQQTFIAFVLAHYVSEGVRELDQEKLTPLLRLKYDDLIADAVADLGRPEEIGKVFAGFRNSSIKRRHNRLGRNNGRAAYSPMILTSTRFGRRPSNSP